MQGRSNATGECHRRCGCACEKNPPYKSDLHQLILWVEFLSHLILQSQQETLERLILFETLHFLFMATLLFSLFSRWGMDGMVFSCCAALGVLFCPRTTDWLVTPAPSKLARWVLGGFPKFVVKHSLTDHLKTLDGEVHMFNLRLGI